MPNITSEEDTSNFEDYIDEESKTSLPVSKKQLRMFEDFWMKCSNFILRKHQQLAKLSHVISNQFSKRVENNKPIYNKILPDIDNLSAVSSDRDKYSSLGFNTITGHTTGGEYITY